MPIQHAAFVDAAHLFVENPVVIALVVLVLAAVAALAVAMVAIRVRALGVRSAVATGRTRHAGRVGVLIRP